MIHLRDYSGVGLAEDMNEALGRKKLNKTKLTYAL